jgi:excisionase family DNA binding protein
MALERGAAMYQSLGQAAAATGVSKSTILRAIKSHRISAARADTGDWEIDPAELHRVFPVARSTTQDMTHGATATEQGATAVLEAQIAGLRETAELLRRQLDDVRADRDEWRSMAQATTRLLPKPEPEVAPPAPKAKRRWWRRAG